MRPWNEIIKEKKEGTRIMMEEQYDTFQLWVNNLLDEGYAETQEQAEVIMVNMSESWKNSILG